MLARSKTHSQSHPGIGIGRGARARYVELVPRYSDLTDRWAVDAALAEFDRLGRDAFLHQHGFGRARDYMLVTETGRYDSKAIFGVAIGYQHGTPLGAAEFSGGRAGAAGRLAELGYSITGINLSASVGS